MNGRRFFPVMRFSRCSRLTGLLICAAFTAIWLISGSGPRDGTLFANQAWAKDGKAPLSAPPADATPAAGTPDKATTETVAVFRKDPLEALADSLRAKQLELDEREKALAEREKCLEALNKDIEQKLGQIKLLIGQMEEKATRTENQRKKEMSKWAAIYQAMPPEKAGSVIQGMEPAVALELLSQMEPRKAGKILGFVAPDQAVELSKKLGRNRP